MMNAMKPPFQETMSDDAPVKFIDSFHQQAFPDNLGVPNISDVEEEQGEFASKAIRGLKMRTLSKMKTVVIVIRPVSLPMQEIR